MERYTPQQKTKTKGKSKQMKKTCLSNSKEGMQRETEAHRKIIQRAQTENKKDNGRKILLYQ